MSPRVSVVAPVHDEARVLLELARRCLAAAREVDAEAEVVLVDDASTDATASLAPALPAGVRMIRLPRNLGQLGATQVGLAHAAGEVVVVIDGDLQDPPELLPRLVRRLDDAVAVDVVFAVKSSRRDPAWFRAGRAVYGLLAALPGARAVPAGAGAYCAMRRPLARRAASVSIRRANLAPLLVALGARSATVPYEKAARYDGVSRVGPLGLAQEALGSLVLTGSLARLAHAAAVAVALLAAVGRRKGTFLASPVSALVLVPALWLGGVLLGHRARRALATAPPPQLPAREATP